MEKELLELTKEERKQLIIDLENCIGLYRELEHFAKRISDLSRADQIVRIFTEYGNAVVDFDDHDYGNYIDIQTALGQIYTFYYNKSTDKYELSSDIDYISSFGYLTGCEDVSIFEKELFNLMILENCNED